MWIGGSIVRFRHDVDEDLGLVGVGQIECELTYVLEDVAAPPAGIAVVVSGTAAGDQLLARLESDGMPGGLAGMGFAGTGDLWPPWCAALWDGAVASVAFAARLSSSGVEAGVATAPDARGRGLAATATAAGRRTPILPTAPASTQPPSRTARRAA